MSSKMLRRLMDDSALELLLIMAQHVSHVSPLSPSGPLHTATHMSALSSLPLDQHLTHLGAGPPAR